MKAKLHRRDFMKSGTIACCSLLFRSKLSAMTGFTFQDDKLPDPLKMNYCGYTCPENCKFLEASLKNDPELKKEAFEIWEMKERFGVETFEADKVFCFGCKTKDKPVGIRLQKCDVRACAISKKYEACIECSNLPKCEKDLWKKFPEFHQSVVKLQLTYLESIKQ
jgi:hypothetical protein